MVKCSKCEKWANLFTDPAGKISSLCSECFEKETSPNNTVQEWLNKKYLNKEEAKEIYEDGNRFARHNLLIADFPNLKWILFRGGNNALSIPKFEIRNCPKLEKIIIDSCQMKEIITDDLPNLIYLELNHNRLISLDVSKYPNLKYLSCWIGNENLPPLTQIFTQKIQAREQELKTRLRESEDNLKELLGKAREEIIVYKLKVKERKLENFAQKLGINRKKVRDLCRYYQKLIRELSLESVDSNVVMSVEDEIEKIKDELLSGGWFTWKVSLGDTQKLCRKCESIAKLKVEQDKLYQEQFEVRQEVVLHSRK